MDKEKYKLIYEKAKEFQKKFPLSIVWRVKQHCKVVALHINEDEEVRYVFLAQKNDNPLDVSNTYVIVLTNKRILLGSKRLIFGYFYTAITPDMFNDLSIKMGLIWGKVCIDTVKEKVYLSNVQREALDEIETEISEYMMNEKRKYSVNQ